MKSQNYLKIFILCSVILFACSKSYDNKSGDDSIHIKKLSQTADVQTGRDCSDDLTILRNLLSSKGSNAGDREKGRIVNFDLAWDCISLYKPTMLHHRIVENPSKPEVPPERGPKFENYRMITEYVEFEGNNLLEWMIGVAQKFDKEEQGRNLTFRIYQGFYNKAFLDTYVNDQELKEKMQDRNTTFLVAVNLKTNDLIGRDDKDDGTVYNLGGLYP